jgi:hypothetical protein
VFVVNGYEVNNYKEPKKFAGKDLKPPSKYYSGKFKPGICALNNQIVFISVGAHQMGNHYNRAACNLKPHCHIKWNKGDPITRVFIFSTPSHPKNNQEVWVCLHHGQASLSNVQLQVQTMYIECRVRVTGSGSEKDEGKVEGKKVEEKNVEKKMEKKFKEKVEEKKVEVKIVPQEVTDTEVIEDDEEAGIKSPTVPRTRAKKVEGSSVKVSRRGEQVTKK